MTEDNERLNIGALWQKIRVAAPFVLPMFVLLTAFLLRLFRLGYHPVWSDEIYSIAVARHSASEVAGWVYRDNHPALYWFILFPVVHLLGDTEFLARFPSALLGTLTVALLYTTGNRMFGKARVGFLAALWLAVSPIHVVYSQETRMYALLAFCGLASTLLLYRAAGRGGAMNWVLFGALAAATAHSHNYGLILLVAQSCWALGHILVRRDRRSARGLVVGYLVFAVLYAPMVPALRAQMKMPIGSTGVAKPQDVLNVFKAFEAGFVGFSTPGLTPNALMRGLAQPALVLTGGLALLGLLIGIRRGQRRGWAVALLVACFLLPILAIVGYSALFHKSVWQVRGFQMALGCFALLVGAGLAYLRPRALRWIAVLGLVVVAAANLYPHYFERYKSTVPDAVAALDGQLGPGDVIFTAPYWDWTPFRYYYRGTVDAIGGWRQGATLHFVGVGTDYADLIDSRSLQVQSVVRDPIIPPSEFRPERYARVWTVSHQATPKSVLELFGNDVVVMHYDVSERRWRALVYPSPYATDPSRLPLAVETPNLQWEGDLRLVGYSLDPSPVVGQQTRLTMFWTADRPQRKKLHVEVRLTDASGKVWLDQTVPMVSTLHSIPMVVLGVVSSFPTTDWPPGVVVVQDADLELPANLPAISYEVSVRVVDIASGEPLLAAGQTQVTLGSVSVARPPRPYGQRVIPVQRGANVRFGELRLFGYDLPEAAPRPGHYLPLWLHWSAIKAPAADYEVQVRLLGHDGSVVAEATGPPSTPAFPTSSWRAGDLAQSEIIIPLPPQMEGGSYRLVMRLVDVDRPSRSQEWAVVGQAEVAPWPMVTEPPRMAHDVEARFEGAARLLGYDLTGDAAAGGELDVTLYWQVETSLEDSFSVFVHLTDEGGVTVAQADGIPMRWLRPTTTWRPGEVIVDSHELLLPPDLSTGSYDLYVGFYNPETGLRLAVESQGQILSEGRLWLGPVTVSTTGSKG